MAENNEWLKDLKAGDKVCVRVGCNVSTHLVDKITPTGLIQVCGDLFIDGYKRNGMCQPNCTLVKWSEEKEVELRAYVLRRAHISIIKDVPWKEQKDEVIDAVWDVLKGKDVVV